MSGSQGHPQHTPVGAARTWPALQSAASRDSQLMSLSSWLEMGSRYYSKITNRMSRL